MQRYFYLLFLLVLTSVTNAQEVMEDADTTFVNQNDSLKNPRFVCDSFYGVMRSNQLSGLKQFFPDFFTYRESLKNHPSAEQSGFSKWRMYQGFWRLLQMQYVKQQKRAKSMNIIWEKCVKDSIEIDYGEAEGETFAYGHVYFSKGEKYPYKLSFLMIKFGESWYVVDELMISAIKPPRKKKPK